MDFVKLFFFLVAFWSEDCQISPSGALMWLRQGKVHCHNFTLAVKDLLLLTS